MSIEHMALVFAAEGLDASETLLMLAYCNRTDAHGYCWPGIARLADETGMSERTVKRTNVRLKQRNLIKSVRRTDPKTGDPTTNLTRVNISLLRSMRRPERTYDDNLIGSLTFDDTPADAPESAPDLLKCQSVTYPGANLSPTRGQSDTYLGAKLAPNPSVEPSENPPPPPTPHESRAPRPTVGVVKEEEVRFAKEEQATDTAFVLVDQAAEVWESDGHRPPTRAERLKLAERVTAALNEGAAPFHVSYALTHDLAADQVRTTAVQVVMGRTKQPGWTDVPMAPAPAAKPSRPDWCGDPNCSQSTRRRVDPETRDDAGRCPVCHPLSQGSVA